MVLDKYLFDHTKSAFAKKFARLGQEEFVERVTEELGRLKTTPPPSPALSIASLSSAASGGTGSSSNYSFSDASSNNPQVQAVEENR